MCRRPTRTLNSSPAVTVLDSDRFRYGKKKNVFRFGEEISLKVATLKTENM
jgi:hypothetical protein